MTEFRYRVVAETGKILSGVVNAESRDDAVRQLVREGHKPLRVDIVRPGLWAELTKERGGHRFSDRDRVLFMRKLATLVGASVTLEDALQINTVARKKNPSSKLAERLLASLREGDSLAHAMAEEDGIFPEQYVAMVRAGETGGALPKILTRLADMLEQRLKTLEALRSAMIYPAILALTSTIAIATIFIFVLPSFEPMFAQADQDMPALTSAVMSVSRFVNQFGIYLVLGLVGMILLATRLLTIERIRIKWDSFLLGLPGIGSFIQRADLSQMSAVLGTLLMNGVSLDASLKLVRDVPNNKALRKDLADISDQVVDGARISSAFEKMEHCPEVLPQLVRAGENTGQLGNMLQRAAIVLEEDAKRTVQRGVSLLTPILTLVLGGFVAMIVFSVLLAVLSVNELAI